MRYSEVDKHDPYEGPEDTVIRNIAKATTAKDIEVIIATAKTASTHMTDAGLSLRCGATRVLGQLNDDRARRALIDLCEDPVDDVRAAAVVGLGRCGNQESVAQLTKMLADSDPYVRRRAAWALGNLKSPSGKSDQCCTPS